MKRGMPIDDLVAWAIRDGVDPAHGERDMSFAKIIAQIELGTRIDGSRFGGPEWLDDRHPDAILIQNAVFALCQSYQTHEKEPDRKPQLRICWTDQGLYFLGDLMSRVDEREILNQGGSYADCGALYDGPSVNPGALVLQHGWFNNFPRWNYGERLVQVQTKKGTQARWRLMAPNENGKLEEISPIEIARARHEYDCWQRALVGLVDALPVLTDFCPDEPNAPACPWLNPMLTPYHSLINEVINSQLTESQNRGLHAKAY